MKYVVNSARALVRGINKKIEVEKPSIYDRILESYGVTRLVAVNFPKRPDDEVIALWDRVKPWVLWGSPTGRATFCPTSTPLETVARIRNHLGSPIYCREAEAQAIATADVVIHVDSDQSVIDMINAMNTGTGMGFLPEVTFIDGLSLISQHLAQEIFGETVYGVSTFQFRLVSEYTQGVLRGTMLVVADGILRPNEILASKSCAKAGFDLNTDVSIKNEELNVESLTCTIGIMNLGRRGKQYLNKTLPFISNSPEVRKMIKKAIDELPTRTEEIYQEYKEKLGDNFDSSGDIFDILPDRGRHFHLSLLQAMAEEAYRAATSANIMGDTWPYIWGYKDVTDNNGFIFYGKCKEDSHGMLMRESTHEKIKVSMKKLPHIPWIAGDQQFIIGCAINILTVDCDGDLLTYFKVKDPFTAELYKNATLESVWNCGKGLEKKEYSSWEEGVWANLFKVNVGAAFNSVVSVMRAQKEEHFLTKIADKLLPHLVEVNVASTNDLKKEVRGIIDEHNRLAYEVIKDAVKEATSIIAFFKKEPRKIAAFLKGLKPNNEKAKDFLEYHIFVLENEGKTPVERMTRKHDVAAELGYPIPADISRVGYKSDAEELIGRSFVAIIKNSKVLLSFETGTITTEIMGNICFNLEGSMLIESAFSADPRLRTWNDSKILAYIRQKLTSMVANSKPHIIRSENPAVPLAAAELNNLYKTFGLTFMTVRDINKFYRLPNEEYQILRATVRNKISFDIETIAKRYGWEAVAIAVWNMMGTDGKGALILRLHKDHIIPILQKELSKFKMELNS